MDTILNNYDAAQADYADAELANANVCIAGFGQMRAEHVQEEAEAKAALETATTEEERTASEIRIIAADLMISLADDILDIERGYANKAMERIRHQGRAAPQEEADLEFGTV